MPSSRPVDDMWTKVDFLDNPQDWSLLLLCDAERFGGMAACVAARILRHHRNRRWLQWEERKLQHP